MPITDKIAAAKTNQRTAQRNHCHGDFRLRYKILIDPPAGEHDFDKPVIKVDLAGSDSPLVKERGGELLRAFEHVALEMLRLAPDEHDQVIFDCENFRSARQQELRLSANVAADRVRQSGMPYAFAPMSSRERRLVHLALRDIEDLRTESAGESLQRYVVVYPKDYQGKAPAPTAPSPRRR